MFHLQHFENRECILSLCKGEAIAIFLKFNAEEFRRRSEVLESEVLFERGNKSMDLRG